MRPKIRKRFEALLLKRKNPHEQISFREVRDAVLGIVEVLLEQEVM